MTIVPRCRVAFGDRARRPTQSARPARPGDVKSCWAGRSSSGGAYDVPATTVAAQSYPTGRCAVIVKEVDRLADIQPELATVLGAPFRGEPYLLEMEQRPGIGIAMNDSESHVSVWRKPPRA